MNYFISNASEEEIKMERQKARRLRSSPWWRKKKFSGVCYFCGRRFDPNTLTMEHIVPIIRGGKSVKSNLVPACKECNNRKKYLLPIEWQEFMERL